MNPNIPLINQDAFTQDVDMFAQSIRTLLARTNIVRSRDETSRKLYRFCTRPENHQKINDYLQLIGFRIVSDNDGVVYLTENEDTDECRIGHQMLSTETTEMIKILEWLYFEKEKTSTSDRIVIRLPEIYETIEKFGIEYFEGVNVSALDRIFREMAAYNLVRVQGRASQEDFRLEAYPSLKNFYLLEELRSIYETKEEQAADDEEAETADPEEISSVLDGQIAIEEFLESVNNADVKDAEEEDDWNLEEEETLDD